MEGKRQKGTTTESHLSVMGISCLTGLFLFHYGIFDNSGLNTMDGQNKHLIIQLDRSAANCIQDEICKLLKMSCGRVKEGPCLYDKACHYPNDV